jgi:molybdate transport system substrate-binding protein
LTNKSPTNGRAVLRLICCCVLALVCAPAAPSVAQERAVVVYAAISLKEALDELSQRYDRESGTPVKAVYAATSTLARQIDQGAPADLFIAADAGWMDYLQGRRAVRAGTRVDLLTNRLALIAPRASSVSLRIEPGLRLAPALGDGRLAMADPDSVPAGKYGKAALQTLKAWADVEPKVVRAQNVRAALALVARGEAALGIVYVTDAAAEKNVRIVAEFPPGSHPRIVYPAAILAESRSPGAEAFLRFLQSAAARAVWQRHGFAVPQ